MSENEIPGIGEARACIACLERALEQAKTANLAWQKLTGLDFASLVEEYDLTNLIDATDKRVGTRLISHVSTRCFPGLPCQAEEWYDKAREAEVGLAGLAAWYISQVGPTAQEDTWAYNLNEARKMLMRVGEYPKHRREVKQSGRRLTFGLCTWRTRPYASAWSNEAYNCRDRLLGLEAVIRYAMGVDFGLGGRGALYEAIKKQTDVGQALTNWPYAPQIRTFKNCRFDLYLQDEALASKVKAILETKEATT